MSARGLIRAAVAALLALTVAGCGDDELVGLDRVGEPGAKKVLKLQINSSYSPQASVPDIAKGFKKLYGEWARKHPEWRLDLIIVPDTQTTTEQSRLLEKARVNRAPDCANVDSFSVPLFIQQKALTPLDDYFPQQDRADLFPYVRDVITGPDGHIYAWWWSTDLRLIYRNTDLVPDAPRTWDELLADAKKAHDAKGVDGYLFNGGRWEGTTFDNLAYFWMQGGELLDKQGKPLFGNADNAPKMLNELRFLRKAITSGATPSRVATFTSYDEFVTAAAGDNVAMFLGGSFQWPNMQAALSKQQLSKWKVSEIPGMKPGQTATGTGGWTMGAFTKDPDKVAACASILKEIYIGKGNALTGELPTQRHLFNGLKPFNEPIYKTFRSFLKHGQARPGLAVYPQLSSELQVAIGSVLTGSSSPEDALKTATDRTNQAYELLTGEKAK
jgi:multiple sugar transport system substrate-binding protein